ncbi:MAG: ribulokinase [Lentisphaerae bacterium]|nr:ribulokinase [Lentisphaerota bacterium]
MKNSFIGVDFGSDSVRAVLVTADGEILAQSVHNYSRWAQGLYSDASKSQFRQHPKDYLEGLESVIKGVLAGQNAGDVRGIGVDTTGSTPCAVDENGVPLALSDEFAEDPDAMFLLWKDHTALREAEEINALCRSWHTDYTRYEGYGYSPEWFWAKYLHVLRSNIKVREKCCGFVEHCDWITSMLAGVPVKPGRCTAGHKAMWHAEWGGLPPEEFFVALDPLLAGRSSTLYKETFTAEQPVGHLSAYWAEKLGLSCEVVISGGMLDAHSGAIGAAIEEGKMIKVIGTSTCEMLVVPEIDRTIPGICGQVDGSIVPGMVGLEAGQAAFGDIYAWFKRFLSYGGEVDLRKLGEDAAALPVDDTLALDWMNGRRTPDVNPHLTGAIFGINLGTTAPMVFRALVESTAFGAKRIVDRFAEKGVEIRSIAAIGGIAKKSPFVMQTCADVLNMPIKEVASDQACALGAAMFASVASKVHKDIHTAMAKMNSGYTSEYFPNAEMTEIYRRKYLRYLALADAVEKETMDNLH